MEMKKRFYSYPADNGTGIGLAFCRDTLTAWGGQISCNSEEGKYTEFIIQLPLSNSTNPGSATEAQTMTLEQRKRGFTVSDLLEHQEARKA
jgi:hypothetical protein